VIIGVGRHERHQILDFEDRLRDYQAGRKSFVMSIVPTTVNRVQVPVHVKRCPQSIF